jgi:hypothetical protein
MVQKNQDNPSLAPDEIDLVQVFVKVVDFFRNNYLIFLILNALGIALGILYFKLKSPVYESRLIGECHSIPDSRSVDLLSDLENLRMNEDWKLLGNKLKMTEADAKLIKKIEPLSNIAIEKQTKGLDDYLLPTLQVSYTFGVIARVKDNKILPKLQNGIVHYLSSNEFSQLRYSRFYNNGNTLKDFIHKEIKKLDSVNTAFADKVVSGRNNVSTLTSPGDYKTIVIDLMGRILDIEDQLKFSKPVTIIQPFMPFKNPVEPNPNFIILLSVALANAFAFLFIIIIGLTRTYRLNKSK